jgi:hypothetical protein
MELLNLSDFVDHVGKAVRIAGTPHTLVLDRVEGQNTPPSPGNLRSPFVVIFCGPSKTDVMPTGLYECKIEDGPVYSLYIMPIHTSRPDRQEYQAAFN